MVKLGNFFFHYRNVIFPVFFVALVFATKPLSWGHEFDVARNVLGIAIALGGQVVRGATIGLAYIIRGGRDRRVYAEKLVTEGVFNHSRNPLYLGNIMIVIGLGIVAHSLPFYAIGIPAFLFMYMAITRAEEDFLGNKFGQDYVDYCKRVGRFIPDFRGFGETLKSMRFNWARLIIKEYGTTYVWVMGCIILMLRGYRHRMGLLADEQVQYVYYGLMVTATLLYALARYLKKSKRLTEQGFLKKTA